MKIGAVIFFSSSFKQAIKNMSLPTTVKALLIQEDKKGVSLVDFPFAEQEKVKNLPDNEIIIRVKAIGINPVDAKNAYWAWGLPGAVVGCDAAGEVVKVGKEVKHLTVGDRVFAFTCGSHQLDNGAFAEYARFRANAAVKMPPEMSYAEGASFPVPFQTAVQVFYSRLHLNPPSSPSSSRSNILIWGGASSVAHHAIQLAHLAGYRVISTASKKNHELVEALGADVVIDYHDADVADQIKEAVKEGGLQYAYDTITLEGSIETSIDSITILPGHVVTTLPITPEIETRRVGVKTEFSIVYTSVVDGDSTYFQCLPMKGHVEDHQVTLDFNVNEVGRLLEGWKEGEGSPLYKAQKLRVGHGLENVQEGLEYVRDGKVSAEKLVYTL